MARQITSNVYCGNGQLAPSQDIKSLTLHQELFGHQTFEIEVPFDNVEGTQEAFLSKAPKRLLGQPLQMNLVADEHFFNKGQTHHFSGVVTSIATSKDTDYSGSIYVRGHSPLYLLTDGLKRRTFVKKSLKNIFEEILSKYPSNLLTYQVNPSHTAVIEFVSQYDETNFDFLNRLATEYGEWFYYDGQTIKMGSVEDKETVFQADGYYNTFTFSMNLRPVKSKFYEYNYQENKKFNSATSNQQVPGINAHPFGGFALEKSEKLFSEEMHISAEMLISSRAEIDEEAKLWKANIAAELIHMQGESNNPELRIGQVINITGEGIGSRNITTQNFGKYRLISISHFVDGAGNYSNIFNAVPHFLNVPPLRPGYSAPHGSPELAEVIDDKDPKKLGRLRVRYYWPVQNPQQAETDWIRVLTPYSGSGKGQLMKPEVGSQVLVGYQDGLAEQPFVMGNMFHANNAQKASYSPENNSMKGIQTAGGNKFVMQDKAGEQSITISNSNNKGSAIEVNFAGDGSISIKSNGPISLTAGGDISLTAKKDITLTAENVTINAKQNITKTAKQIALTGSEKVDLEGKATTISAGDTMKIAASSSLDVNGGSKASISSGKTKIH